MRQRKTISLEPNKLCDVSGYDYLGHHPFKCLFYYKSNTYNPVLYYFPNDLEKLPRKAISVHHGFMSNNVGPYYEMKMGHLINSNQDVIRFVKRDIGPGITIWFLTRDKCNKLDPYNVLAITDEDFQEYTKSIATVEDLDDDDDEINCFAYVNKISIPFIKENDTNFYPHTPPEEIMKKQQRIDTPIQRRPLRLSSNYDEIADIQPVKTRTRTLHPSTPDQSALTQKMVPYSEAPSVKLGQSMNEIKNKTTKKYNFITPSTTRTLDPAQRQKNIQDQTFKCFTELNDPEYRAQEQKILALQSTKKNG